MIQAINTVKTNTYKKQNTSFKQNESADFVDYENFQKNNKRPSKAMQVAGFIGREFVTGAIVSTIIDGVFNVGRLANNALLTKKIAKNPSLVEKLVKNTDLAKNTTALIEKIVNNSGVAKEVVAEVRPLMGAKQMLKRAGAWGALLVVFSTVFAGVSSVIASKNK